MREITLFQFAEVVSMVKFEFGAACRGTAGVTFLYFTEKFGKIGCLAFLVFSIEINCCICALIQSVLILVMLVSNRWEFLQIADVLFLHQLLLL